MRKLGIAILAVIALVVAGALIIPHVININSYHNQIQSELERKLGHRFADLS